MSLSNFVLNKYGKVIAIDKFLLLYLMALKDRNISLNPRAICKEVRYQKKTYNACIMRLFRAGLLTRRAVI